MKIREKKEKIAEIIRITDLESGDILYRANYFGYGPSQGGKELAIHNVAIPSLDDLLNYLKRRISEGDFK